MYTSCVYHSCHEGKKTRCFQIMSLYNDYIYWMTTFGNQVVWGLIAKEKKNSSSDSLRRKFSAAAGFGRPLLSVTKKTAGGWQWSFCPPEVLPQDDWKKWHVLYGCFLEWWYPQNTPKWQFLVGKHGKTNGCWVPPLKETPIYLLYMQSCICAGCFSPHHLSDDLQSS